MTYAPADLKTIRSWLIATLNVNPAPTAADLEPDEVGIVGDPAHMAGGGYHLGNDDLARIGRLNTDYSKRESARDRPGTNAASALDIGQFTTRGHTLASLSVAVVDACRRGDPRCRDVREVIYSPDGRTVKRYDRLGLRTTGDSSHLFHTHLTFFRDSEGHRAQPDNILGLLQELLRTPRTESITLPTPTGDTMQMLIRASDTPQIWLADGMFRRPIPPEWVAGVGNAQIHAAGYLGNLGNNGQVFTAGSANTLDAWGVDIEAHITARVAELAAADQARDTAAKAAIDAIAATVAAGGGSVDTAAVINRINEVAATESTTVAALRADIAQLRTRLAAAAQAEATSLTQP